MTKKSKVRFVCQSCGHVNPQWVGRCPGCGEWNSVVEEIVPEKSSVSRGHPAGKSTRAVSLSQVGGEDVTRITVGIDELDRVLGGGLVGGSVVLVGGDPGVGKTTLLMQALSNLAKKGISVLYVTGEESCAQLKIRGERLGLETERLLTIFATDISDVLAAVESPDPPKVVVIDSIQTTSTDEIESPP